MDRERDRREQGGEREREREREGEKGGKREKERQRALHLYPRLQGTDLKSQVDQPTITAHSPPSTATHAEGRLVNGT